MMCLLLETDPLPNGPKGARHPALRIPGAVGNGRFSAWGRARPRAVVTPAEDAGGVSGECRSLSSLLYPPPSRSAPATGTGSEAWGLGPTGVPGCVGEVQSPRARVRAWAQAWLDLLNCQAAFRSGRPFPLPGRGLGRVECVHLVCVPADAYRLPLLILASWWARLRFHHWSLREAWEVARGVAPSWQLGRCTLLEEWASPGLSRQTQRRAPRPPLPGSVLRAGPQGPSSRPPRMGPSIPNCPHFSLLH